MSLALHQPHSTLAQITPFEPGLPLRESPTRRWKRLIEPVTWHAGQQLGMYYLDV